MIDSASRQSSALLLRRLASGRITNREYEDQRITSSADPTVEAVSDAGWSLYGDYRTYRLRGPDALSPQTLAAVGRCVLFLKSGREYEWPSRRPSLLSVLLALLTFGQLGPAGRFGRWRWEATGDYSVWPFFRRSDYKRALASPPFMTGGTGEAA